MKPWFTRLTLLTLVLLSVGGLMAASQEISGTVKDNTGGVIPGVTVVLTNVETGQVRQVLSSDEGDYLFTNIKPGTYEIRSELEGFQPMKLTGVKVSIGDKLSYPLVMTISNLTTEVEVKAEVEQVETTTSQLDNVIDEKRITDLPLNGRNPLALIFLTPGVALDPSTGDASANGGRARGNNYQLDGMDNNDTSVIGQIVSTNVDATEEFRVITSNPSAEYGRAGGAIIDAITKSGTNQIHGNAFWFNRNDNLDAATWAENYYDTGKGEFKQDQFGASVGGPIIKDKLFYFFNTQIGRFNQAGTAGCYTPTQEFRDMVTNPAIASIFQQYYPLANSENTTWPGVNGQYVWADPYTFNDEQYTVKIDYTHSENHTFYGRYFYNTGEETGGNPLPTTDLGQFPSAGHQWSLTLDWTWILSPTLVNDLKVGQNRNIAGWERVPATMDLSFAGGWYSDPTFYFTDFGGPTGYGDQIRYTGTFELKDTVTWTKGDHNIKFGIDFRWVHSNTTAAFYNIPTAAFDQLWGGVSEDTTANLLAGATEYTYSAIYGNGETFTPGDTDWGGWRARERDFFIQDDWKILPNLTLNLGLRAEQKPPYYEVNGKSVALTSDFLTGGYHLPNPGNFFDPNNWNDGMWWNLDAIYQGSGVDLVLAGRKRDADLYDTAFIYWAPRAGFSWDPWGDGKTAIRGGYGISYDRMFENLLLWLTGQYPFAVSGFTSSPESGHPGVYPDLSYYGNGQPIPEVVLHPTATFGVDGYTDDMVAINPNWSQPYIQTWNLSIQRELWPGNIVNVSYVGSAGVNLLGRQNPNAMANPSPELLQSLADETGITTSIPWYVRYYSAPNTQIGRIQSVDTYAHSNYNALQTSFSHRFQDGLQFQINYSWSKAFDNSSEVIYSASGYRPFSSAWDNSGYDRGYSNYDRRHVFNGNFIYELPLGPGKWIGGDTEGILAQIIGGWQLNGIVTAYTGSPMDYKVARDTLGTGYTNTRAPARPWVASWNFTTDPSNNILGPTAANFQFSTAYINLANPQGNYYRGFFRTPGLWNMDLSFFKDVKLPWFTAEGSKLQLRFEAFNLFNHTNWSAPTVTLTSANLGKSYGSVSNRQIQLGIKFIF